MFLLCSDIYEPRIAVDPRCSVILNCRIDLWGMWGKHNLPIWLYRVNNDLALEVKLTGSSIYNDLSHFVDDAIATAPCSSGVVIESRTRNPNWDSKL